MAGYMASARLRGGDPRFVGEGSVDTRVADQSLSAGIGAAAEALPVADRVELVGRPLDEAVAEWLASVGEAWSQLTFFLFDPDSWR